ncbi:MAG: hypothetical protein ACRDH9_08385 [Actinomycetota bacterium]
MTRWLLLAGGAAALIVLFVVLKPGSDEPAPNGSPTSTTSPSVEPTATESTSEATSEPTSTPSLDAIEIEVEDGQVQGPERITVTLGDRISIEVEADVADEIHVHGYDLMFDTEPGEKVLVQFKADIPGIFEIELENAGLLLTSLEVTA